MFIQEMMTVSKSYQSDLLPLELDKNIKTEFEKRSPCWISRNCWSNFLKVL